MSRIPQLCFIVSFSAFCIFVAGCGSGTSEDPPKDKGSQGNKEPHVDEHGPNGGHLIRLTPADYTAEWVHDDKAETVTVIILDKEAKQEVAVPAGSVEIEANIGAAITYSLDAVSPSADDPPKSSRFEKKQPELLTALKMTKSDEEATAHLILKVDGKTYRGKIEHHEHGHKH